jgi:biopolymer transport protein TolR
MGMLDAGRKGKKDLNFELNLLPVFDILSVCICFLLMTVVWVQVGALKASQSLGGQAQSHAPNPPAVWAYLNPGGEIVLNLKDVSSKEVFARTISIPGQNGVINWSRVTSTISSLESHAPSVKTALIMPSKVVAYNEIIQLMDQMKKFGIRDVGISPL